MDKVSVIVPIYNAEKYISECIESITCQTYKNLEIILINDGSLDNSIKICKQYAKNDDRIKLIDGENHGVSYARNKGIEEATGEYIIFIDSDDIIKENYIDILIKEINSDINLDLAVCTYEEISLNERSIFKLSSSDMSLLTGTLKKDYYLIKDFLNTPWGKLYKLNIIKRYKIMFPNEHSIGEDQIFNYKYFLHVENYRFINKPMYLYMHRDNISLTKIKNKESFYSDLFNFKLKKSFLEKMNIKEIDEILSEWAILLVNKYVFISDEKNNYKNFKDRVKKIKEIFSSIKVWDFKIKKVLSVIFFKYNMLLPFYLNGKINSIKNKKVENNL